jgi:transposase-like protein
MNSRQNRYSPEVRERAVRMVLEHQGKYDSQWAAINSIAGKIGCNPETLRNWVRQAERDQPRVGARDRARARGELLRLRGAQGLAAVESRAHRCGPLHGRAADAFSGPAGRGARSQMVPHDGAG